MDAQEFFYLTASIGFILISLFVVALFFIALAINKAVKTGMARMNYLARDFADNFGSFSKNWGKAAAAGIVVRIIKSLIFRR